MTTFHNRQRWQAHAAAQPDPADPSPAPGPDPQPDDLACARGILRALQWSLALWLVGIAAAVAVLWPVGTP